MKSTVKKNCPLREAMIANGSMTVRDLAQKAGVAIPTIYNMLNQGKATSTNIMKVAQALHVSTQSLELTASECGRRYPADEVV